MPGSVPLNAPRVFSELTNYLADDWKPIIDTDVDGEGFGPGPHRRRTAHLRGAEPDPPDRPHRLRRLRSYPWAPRTRGSRSRDYGWVSRSQATRSATSGPRWSCSANAPHTCTTTRPATGTTPPRRSPAPAADMADRLREEPEQVWAEIIRRLRATAGKQTGAFTGRAHRPGNQRRRPRQRGRPTDRDPSQVRARQIRPQQLHPGRRRCGKGGWRAAMRWPNGSALHPAAPIRSTPNATQHPRT
jgi:hypothetical protein